MKQSEEKSSPQAMAKKSERGFTLIEVSMALMILLVALLGIFATITYAVNYNAGNNSRAQALSVLQREIELYRSAKFTPEITDNYTPSSSTDDKRDLTGGTKTTRIITAADGGRYKVDIKVDNDIATSGIQATGESTTTLKEISITVALDNPTPGWQSSVPTTVVLRRTRAN
jgi:prepilin-type N-terminal cleavage/methylation domain-containing protein